MDDRSDMLIGWEAPITQTHETMFQEFEANPIAIERPKNECDQNEDERSIREIINNGTIKYIFVLAGGLQESGKVNIFVKSRLNKAIEIYNSVRKYRGACKIVVMGGGTYHKPPILNEYNYVIHESSSCADYLYRNDIPQKDIYREWASYDTIANGYYAFLNYIQPLNIKEFTLITSSFHILRAQTIFNYFNDIIFHSQINIQYIETENTDMDPTVLNERYERESNSRLSFKKNIVGKIHNIQDFTMWLYEEHCAYKSIIYYEQNDKINRSY